MSRHLGALCLAIAVATQVWAPLANAASTPQKADFEGPPELLHEQVLSVPGGDAKRPVTLQVTLMTPPGPGPFPLAILNHGSAQPGQAPSDMPRYRVTFEAYYFLSRGYAVALPMLRGFGASGGHLENDGCDVAKMGVDNAKDIRGVIPYLAQAPNIDTSRVVMSGQSLGGWNTLAFGTIAGPNVKGLISFAGGVRTSSCSFQDSSMAFAAEKFGRATKIPSLWFHGDNDHMFPPSTWRTNFKQYTAAGGPAELVAYGPFGKDAHQFLSSGEAVKIWAPRVDAFLGRIGLPNQEIYPQYMPVTPPPPSHFAAIDDVSAVPYADDAMRALYRRFLAGDMPRALVISPHSFIAEYGGVDPLTRALRECQSHGPGCQVYAYDNDVVWTPPVAAPARLPPSRQSLRSVTYSKTIAAGVTSTLGVASSVNPDCSVRVIPDLIVTQPPRHGTVQIQQRDAFPSFAAGSPYQICNKAKVASVAIDYTPDKDFTGSDILTVKEITLEEEKVFKLSLTVK